VRGGHQEYQELRQREKLDLIDEDRARIVAMAKDLPAVWNAKTTTNLERKNLLRLVVREVTLSPIDVPARMTRVQVLWHTGAVSDFRIARPSQYTALATSAVTRALIRDLYLNKKKHDREIATELNRRGLRTGQDRSWDLVAVRHVRCDEGIFRPSPKARFPPQQRADGLYSVHAVAARAGVKPALIRYWARTGAFEPVAHGRQGRPHWFKLDPPALDRLRDLVAQHAQRRLPGQDYRPRRKKAPRNHRRRKWPPASRRNHQPSRRLDRRTNSVNPYTYRLLARAVGT
jgi:MerR HTH family regulatory protein